MECTSECFACFLKQLWNTMEQADVPEDRRRPLLQEACLQVAGLDPRATPADNSTGLMRWLHQAIGNPDPYRAAREASNQLALALLPELEARLAASPDPLSMALRISAAGNIIDLGILPEHDVEESLAHCLETGFAIDHGEAFLRRAREERRLLVLGDNAGEIVFDRVLVEALAAEGIRVTYVVKGGPILNDAILEDAEAAGLSGLAELATTGSDRIGVSLDDAPESFLARLRDAPLILSKGQANFESLEAEPGLREKTFFLLRLKCASVAKAAGGRTGDAVLLFRGQPATESAESSP